MPRLTRPERPRHVRFGLLLATLALLLAATACSGGDSVFTTNADGSPGTTGTLPGGLIDTGGTDGTDGTGTAGSGNSPGALAAAIPAGAQAYAGLDLTALPDLMRLVEAFGAADPALLEDGLAQDLGEGLGLGEGLDLGDQAGEAVEGVTEAQDLLTCLGDSLGLDAASLPGWLGDEAALAAFDMQFDPATGDTTDPNMLLTAAVEDAAAAGAFLDQVVAALESGCMPGAVFEQTEYSGVTVHRGESPDGQSLAMAVADGSVMLAVGAGLLERAIDLDGGSLADDPDFSQVLAALPPGRHLSAYLSRALLQEAAESMAGLAAEGGEVTLPSGLDPTQALADAKGLGAAATMLPEGIRLDLVAVGDLGESMPLPESAESRLPDLLPADALGFMGIGPFDVTAAWDGLMEVLAQMPVEEGQPGIQESIQLLGFMLGIDLEEDLIGQLTGEAGVGVLPATAGSLVDGSGVNLGLIAVMGVKDAGAMADTVAAMAQGLAQMSETPASPRPYEGGTLYALSDGTSDIALFGMAGDDMVITTHESHAAALLAGGPRLAGSARFIEGIAGLPPGAAPLMYLDIAALVASLGVEAEEAAAVAPLQTVAVGTAGRDGAGIVTVFARIDY